MDATPHVHSLIVPQGWDVAAAWFETWIWGKPLVDASHPCTAIVWWCLGPECPESAVPTASTDTAAPYDQDAST